MKEFLIGLIFLLAVLLLAGIGILLFPLLLVLFWVLRLIISILLIVFSIWLLGKLIIFTWEKIFKAK